VLLAAVPALFLLIYIYRRDRRKPEPKGLVLYSVFLGFLSTVPALVLGYFLDPVFSQFTPFTYIVLTAFVTSALVEESSKLLVIRKFMIPKKEFDEVFDGIIYTMGASMGFAILENLLYSVGNPPSLMILRGITAVPLHATASGIMGYYIGRAKFDHPLYQYIGLFYGMLIHGTYNFLLFTASPLSVLIIPLLLLSWQRLKKLVNRALLEDRFYGRS